MTASNSLVIALVKKKKKNPRACTSGRDILFLNVPSEEVRAVEAFPASFDFAYISCFGVVVQLMASAVGVRSRNPGIISLEPREEARICTVYAQHE